MTRTLLLTTLLTLFFAGRASAETLTNDDVIALHKAGLSTEVIVQKITTSTAAFDTSATALIGLKGAGVPDAVITAMLQSPTPSVPAAAQAPTTPQSSSDAPLPGPHFAESGFPLLWNGTCQVSFRYSNKEIYIGGETCRGHYTHQWQDIRAVCFTFWEQNIGKPRNGRESFLPSRKAEVDLLLRDGSIVTYGTALTKVILALKQHFEQGYPEILRCDATYD